jgi:hypothetical protein
VAIGVSVSMGVSEVNEAVTVGMGSLVVTGTSEVIEAVTLGSRTTGPGPNGILILGGRGMTGKGKTGKGPPMLIRRGSRSRAPRP